MADPAAGSVPGALTARRGGSPLVLATTTEHGSIQDAVDDVNEPRRSAASTPPAHRIYYGSIIALGLLVGALQHNVVVIAGAVLLAMTMTTIWAYNRRTFQPRATQHLALGADQGARLERTGRAMRMGQVQAWACLAVLLTVAVVTTAVILRSGTQLPSELRFTGSKLGRTTIWPTPIVLAAMWILTADVPVHAWMWFRTSITRAARSGAPYGPLAGMTTSAGIFAITFIIHYGGESPDRAKDGLFAVLCGLIVGLLIHVLRPLGTRTDVSAGGEQDSSNGRDSDVRE
ncbi:MAG: hypothetical protein ACK5MR_18235 [Cumulibacter sp.]